MRKSRVSGAALNIHIIALILLKCFELTCEKVLNLLFAI